jgi:TetR/AcrR family transcriptional regulator, fatty acid metabolism regulator protein
MPFDLTKYQNKKNKIIDATYQAIYDLGVAKISMRSIAKEAKINQPTLHYYFKTRENLLTELIRALFDRFVYDITRAVKPSDHPEKKLNALLESVKTHVAQEREMLVVFVEVWSLAIKNPAMQSLFANLYKELYAVIDNIVDEGVRKGVFNEPGKKVVPIFMMTFVEGLGLLWHMREQCFDKMEQFDLFVKALRGLLAKTHMPSIDKGDSIKIPWSNKRSAEQKKVAVRLRVAKGDTKRDELINATLQCIYNLGAEEVSMRCIAREANVNQATVHYYFQTKDNLLLECIQALFDQFIFDIERQYHASDPPEKKLDAIFHAGRTYVSKQRELFVIFMHCWALSMRNPVMHKKFSELYDTITGVIEKILTEGVRKEAFHKVEITTLSNYIVAFVEGVGCQWLMTSGAFDLNQLFEIFIADCKRLIVKEPRKATPASPTWHYTPRQSAK